MARETVKIGLERICEDPSLLKNLGNCAVVCNQASVDFNFQHSADILFQILGKRLVAIFGPQHGYKGTVQDNMIETEDSFDQNLKIPIYSLYGRHREPTREMLKDVDIDNDAFKTIEVIIGSMSGVSVNGPKKLDLFFTSLIENIVSIVPPEASPFHL